jgi:hypothetical protein
MLTQVRWLVEQVDAMGAHRNDPAHTPVNVAMLDKKLGVVIPAEGAGRKPVVKRLMKTPTARVWRVTRGDLYVLAAFAQAISTHLLFEDHMKLGPLPRRPRLLSVPRGKQAANEKCPPR